MKIKRSIFRISILLLLSLLASPVYIFAIQRDFHGTLIDDPYYWLEDMHSPKTEDWLDNQVNLISSYFQNLSFREKINTKIKKNSKIDSYSIPCKIKNSLYFLMRDKDLEKYNLYIQDEFGNRKILVDMKDSKNNSLTGFIVSPNEKILTYGISNSGSDIHTWKFLKLKPNDNNEPLQNEITNIKFSSPQWKNDRKMTRRSSRRDLLRDPVLSQNRAYGSVHGSSC